MFLHQIGVTNDILVHGDVKLDNINTELSTIKYIIYVTTQNRISIVTEETCIPDYIKPHLKSGIRRKI